VPQIMKSEVIDACRPAVSDELLGDPVRIPRSLTKRMASEHEDVVKVASGTPINPLPLAFEQALGVGVQRDPVRATRLSGRKDRAIGSFDPRSLE
jgi:hypothetical protein